MRALECTYCMLHVQPQYKSLAVQQLRYYCAICSSLVSTDCAQRVTAGSASRASEMTKAEVAAGTQPGGKSPASKPSANPVRAISTADKKTKPKPAAKAPAVKAPVSGTGTGRGGDLAQAPPLSRDWSEALDLPEPSLEDVEQQIQAALERELRPAGQEMTEVRASHRNPSVAPLQPGP